jgi:RND family efflux transporter MFP subunit
MRKLATIAVILALVVAAFIVGSMWNRQGRSPAAVPQEKSESTPAAPSIAEEDAFAPGTVSISPEKRQLVGIRIAEVRKEPVTHSLRVLGRVAADETRLFIINAATSGWIMEIAPVTPGALVRKGDVLATFYAPELLGAQQSYLYGLNTLDRLKEGGQAQPTQIESAQVNIAQYRDALVNLGMSNQQLDEISKRRERVQQVEMRSPAKGIVVWRNIFPGLKFIQGAEFFRIADLSRVWIYLDVFENETKYLKPGVKSKVSLAGQQIVFEAAVSDVLPLFDPSTRTMKVRLEAENPRYALRPDMFVDVELPIELSPTLAVPTDAVLDTGLKKTVFVDRGEGFFEPREVEVGWRLGNRVEITKGLEPGERIVVSGTFLIDSESRMELAAAGMAENLSPDPVCGLPVSIRKAEQTHMKSVYRGKTYYFCSGECKDRFDQDPGKYADPASGTSEAPK